MILEFVFGAILQYANLNKFNVISGLATLDNLAVVKAISIAIGIGMMLLSIAIGFDLATYHIKPFIFGGIVFGGFIFGAGMAILGYCPGTLAISAGEGSIDAVIGVLGGLLGGFVYTLLTPQINSLLGPDFGTISLSSLMGTSLFYYILIAIIGSFFIWISFWMNKIEKVKDNKWIVAGIALAILNVIIFSMDFTNRPIGASTSFPYLADFLTGLTNNDYFTKFQVSGNWEFIFLSGAFLAGLIISLIKKEFKLVLIYSHWEKFKGTSSLNRVIWSFVGGFILIMGARMAEGCTSGHILSGGMQLSISSFVFAIFTFAGLLLTGKLFYKKS